MGTRSNIGVERADGSVIGIYCHWDGYPSHHVPILTKHYNTEALALALVEPGDMSSLAESVGEKHNFDARPDGQCNYYGRDRGEKNTEARIYPTREAFDRDAHNDYAYLFRGGKWWGRAYGGAWGDASLMVQP